MITRRVNLVGARGAVVRGGIVIRTTVQSISSQGRSTQGVRIMRTEPGDRVASVAEIDLSAGAPPEAPKPATNGARPRAGTNGNGRKARRNGGS